MEYDIGPRPLIVYWPQEPVNQIFDLETTFSCQRITTNKVFSWIAEGRKVQMTGHKSVESANSQHFAKGWQSKVNIFESYSEY